VIKCFLTQNFTGIGQSAAQLRLKRFLRWRPSAIFNFKNITFKNFYICSCDCHQVLILMKLGTKMHIWKFHSCICAPNFIKIGRFFIDIWRFYNLQNGGRPPHSKFRVCHVASVPCYFTSLCKFSLKLDNRLLSYGQKRFLMAAVCHLEF